MDIKKEYEDLYEQWLKEFDKPGLTSLPGNLLKNYKKLLSFIDDYNKDYTNSLEKELYEDYKQHIHYLYEDLLTIRKRKIMDAALSLQELDLTLLFEGEKRLYQNIVASIKDYQKEKSLSLSPSKRKSRDLTEEKPQNQVISKTEGKIKGKMEPKTEEKVKVDPLSSSEIQPETYEAIPQEKEMRVSKTEEVPKTDESPEKKRKIIEEEEEIDYILLRFLNNTPSLVGADLRNYGPFKKEDIAYLPYKNGIILVNEELAEIISLE